MRFFLHIIFTALAAMIAAYFIAWWGVAVAAFLIALILHYKAGRSFVLGMLGVMLCWLVVILFRDLPNEHILSGRMAKVFGLPNYFLFVVVTLFLGGLVGGVSAWAGALMSAAFRKK
jgi:hypothetical protein